MLARTLITQMVIFTRWSQHKSDTDLFIGYCLSVGVGCNIDMRICALKLPHVSSYTLSNYHMHDDVRYSSPVIFDEFNIYIPVAVDAI